MKLLFVCTGNVCRSPMAEAMARKLLAERGRDDIEVASAGTATIAGAPASEGAYLVGLEHGLDLADHGSQPLTAELVAGADLVLGMSAHHVERVEALGGRGRAHLLGDYAGSTDTEVDDPFGGDLAEYRDTYARLESLIRDAVERLLAEGGGAGERRH